jgi:hypothetical protein
MFVFCRVGAGQAEMTFPVVQPPSGETNMLVISIFTISIFQAVYISLHGLHAYPNHNHNSDHRRDLKHYKYEFYVKVYFPPLLAAIN